MPEHAYILNIVLSTLADDDGDGVAEEDCATPPPSKAFLIKKCYSVLYTSTVVVQIIKMHYVEG